MSRYFETDEQIAARKAAERESITREEIARKQRGLDLAFRVDQNVRTLLTAYAHARGYPNAEAYRLDTNMVDTKFGWALRNSWGEPFGDYSIHVYVEDDGNGLVVQVGRYHKNFQHNQSSNYQPYRFMEALAQLTGVRTRGTRRLSDGYSGVPGMGVPGTSLYGNSPSFAKILPSDDA